MKKLIFGLVFIFLVPFISIHALTATETQVLIQTLTAQIASLQAQIQAMTGSTSSNISTRQVFHIGDRVQATANLRVRSSASPTGQILTTQPIGSIGFIKDAPGTASDGSKWWKIDWANSYSGWSIVGYVSLAPLVDSNTSVSAIKTTSSSLISNTAQQIGRQGSGIIYFENSTNSSVQSQNTTPNISNVSNQPNVVTVGPGPTNVTISASPLWFNSVSDNNFVTLSWSSSGADYCMSAFPFTAPTRLSSSGNTSVGPIKQTTSFSVNCFNALGYTNSGVVTVHVTDQLAPTATISASPDSLPAGGGYVSLSWSSNVGSGGYCSAPWAINGAGAGLPPSGSISNVGVSAYAGSAPITTATTYSVTCYNSSGQAATAGAVVNVASGVAPTVTFTASPTTVASGQPINVAWSTLNATACTLSDGRTFSASNTGTANTSTTLTQSGSVSISCYGSTGITTVQSVPITVTN